MKLFDDAWRGGEALGGPRVGPGRHRLVPGMPDTWPGWEDSAVAARAGRRLPARLPRAARQYDYDCSLYGHFGQGCIHCRIDFDLKTATGIATYLRFIDEAADLVRRYGGSLSGEHGDGQARGALLPKMYGDELVEAFREFKAIWDPDGQMNPGKVVDPYPLDDEPPPRRRLRAAATPDTHFQFPDDGGSFASATLRCVGVGKCRRAEGGTMCPSYMVTREEKHSTRGRARLLFEMLRATSSHDGWQRRAVKEALDLCLACKGCKGECPVNVDMATYKAEFLSHYYEGRLRPRARLRDGLIYWWARLASPAPGRQLVVRPSRRGTQAPAGRLERDIPVRKPTFALVIARERSARVPRFARGAVRPAPRTSRASDARLGSTRRQDSRRRRDRPPIACCSGPTPSTTTSSRAPARRRSRCSKRAGFRGRHPAAPALLRAAALRLRHARHRRAAAGARSSTRSGRRSRPASRWSASSRAASPSSATSSSTSSRTTRTPSGSASRPSCSASSSSTQNYEPPQARAQGAGPRPLPPQGGHAHGRRGGDAAAPGARLRAARLRLLRHGRLVRLRGRASTTCRSPSASACCCRPCGTRPRTR